MSARATRASMAIEIAAPRVMAFVNHRSHRGGLNSLPPAVQYSACHSCFGISAWPPSGGPCSIFQFDSSRGSTIAFATPDTAAGAPRRGHRAATSPAASSGSGRTSCCGARVTSRAGRPRHPIAINPGPLQGSPARGVRDWRSTIRGCRVPEPGETGRASPTNAGAKATSGEATCLQYS